MREPKVVRRPLVSARSLTAIGRPNSGPGVVAVGEPGVGGRGLGQDVVARAQRDDGVDRAVHRSMRSRKAVTTSATEMRALARSCRASSTAGSRQSALGCGKRDACGRFRAVVERHRSLDARNRRPKSTRARRSSSGQRAGHAVADLGKRERLLQHVDDDAVELGRALALVGIAGDQQDAQAGETRSPPPSPSRCRPCRACGYRTRRGRSGRLRRVDLGVAVLAVLGDRDPMPGRFERARSQRADGRRRPRRSGYLPCAALLPGKLDVP